MSASSSRTRTLTVSLVVAVVGLSCCSPARSALSLGVVSPTRLS